MKRRSPAIAATLVALSGCGGDDGEGDRPAAPKETAQTPAMGGSQGATIPDATLPTPQDVVACLKKRGLKAKRVRAAPRRAQRGNKTYRPKSIEIAGSALQSATNVDPDAAARAKKSKIFIDIWPNTGSAMADQEQSFEDAIQLGRVVISEPGTDLRGFPVVGEIQNCLGSLG